MPDTNQPVLERSDSQVSADCPSDDDLLAFLPGLLPEESAASVAGHLQTCVVCRSRVTTLKKRVSVNAAVADAPSPADAGAGSEPTIARTAFHRQRRAFPSKLGQYELLEQVGRGGMGLVFKAFHPLLQRHVAIKLLPGLQLSEPTAVVRLRRETAAVGKLEHDNVVYAFDAGEQDGVDYLVMEFVEGIDLSHLVEALGPLPIADACEIARQAALGLAHIEACGLVHRDIKPSNLMLARDGRVKILDLGLARWRAGQWDEAEATHSGFLLGTADYISPEQIDNPRTADVRSDLYSLGCALFKLLCGRAPFGDEQHSSVSRKLDGHRREAAVAVLTLRPDVPPALSELVDRLLSKDPSLRPQHPAELATELAACVAGADLRGLVSRVPEKAEREDRPPRSSPSHTPATAAGTTQREGRTPTPARFARLETITRRPVAWVVAALGLVLLVALALWGAIGSWSGTGESTASGSGREAGQALLTPPLAQAGPVTYDWRQKLTEKIWPGHYPSSVAPAYDEEARMLEVRSDSYRLLALGEYRGEPGSFEVTIRQAPWYGHAGLFFGYRHEARYNKPRVATFQLFMLSHTTQFDEDGNKLREDFGVIRSRSVIDFNPIARYEQFLAGARAPLPTEQQVRLKITFRRNECVAVSLAGQELPTLVTADANGKFEPVDYLGAWGIYHCGGDDRQKPTWFGDIVFTPLENDR